MQRQRDRALSIRDSILKHRFAVKYKLLIIFYALQVIYIFSTIVSTEERQYPSPADEFVDILRVRPRCIPSTS